MPSVDKAILNPFEPLSITEALLVAVCGLVVVFMMLAMLMVVIIVTSKIVAAIEGKKKPAGGGREGRRGNERQDGAGVLAVRAKRDGGAAGQAPYLRRSEQEKERKVRPDGVAVSWQLPHIR